MLAAVAGALVELRAVLEAEPNAELAAAAFEAGLAADLRLLLHLVRGLERAPRVRQSGTSESLLQARIGVFETCCLLDSYEKEQFFLLPETYQMHPYTQYDVYPGDFGTLHKKFSGEH